MISAALERHPGVVRLAIHHYGECGFSSLLGPRRHLAAAASLGGPFIVTRLVHARRAALLGDLGDRRPARASEAAAALAASATPRILELLGEPPARVLELGFAGIHAVPLRLAGFEVVVVEPDPAFRARARERAGEVLASRARRAVRRGRRSRGPI